VRIGTQQLAFYAEALARDDAALGMQRVEAGVDLQDMLGADADMDVQRGARRASQA